MYFCEDCERIAPEKDSDGFCVFCGGYATEATEERKSVSWVLRNGLVFRRTWGIRHIWVADNHLKSVRVLRSEEPEEDSLRILLVLNKLEG